MPRSFPKLAVSPVGRRFDASRGALPTVDTTVAAERPAEPLHCLRPRAIAATARLFAAGFAGDVLYAVKCNPEPRVLRALWAGGIRHFDCASLAEVMLVRQMFPRAHIHFMHPVKARPAIREAAARYGVADFVFDSGDELAKILDETDGRAGGLLLRMAVGGDGARYALTGKFGVAGDEAAALLRTARPQARHLGIAFHVGSQCLKPEAYTLALVEAGRIAAAAGVALDIVDVGGGFPVSYADTVPPPLSAYFAAIDAGARESGLGSGVRLWAEPGRVLVAGGTSVVVQVQLRRGRDLYINDGVYGSLSDAGPPGFRFPVRLIRPDGPDPAAEPVAFRLFGPTCDAADRMDGPFHLPADTAEGDWIEIGQLGAYGASLRTAFNGFDRARLVEVSDPPLLITPGLQAKSARAPRRRSIQPASARQLVGGAR
ncbi:MAG: type III PLP-dependent enzyme [Rhodospirillales bacterium]